VGRVTVFLVGLTVILGLAAGLATAALAGTGVGATFNLGQNNTVNRLSTLVGSVTSPMLRVTNRGSGPALELQVRNGRPPLRVNSSARVANLNADRVDGRDAASFAPAGSAPLWAVVNAEGTFARFKGATSVENVAEGSYVVTFNRDVSACAFAATIYGVPSGQITAQNAPGVGTVYVSTANSSGAAVNKTFHLAVLC
jgi:hypothetical protein